MLGENPFRFIHWIPWQAIRGGQPLFRYQKLAERLVDATHDRIPQLLLHSCYNDEFSRQTGFWSWGGSMFWIHEYSPRAYPYRALRPRRCACSSST